jgi:PqqD family protein of HPr-rel-A system
MHWRIIGDNALRFRRWNQEFVVYNTLSGDIHILDEAATQILQALQTGPCDMGSLAQSIAGKRECGPSDNFLGQIEVMLSDMHALSLVERV